jgi:hypothetical protein
LLIDEFTHATSAVQDDTQQIIDYSASKNFEISPDNIRWF